MHHDEPREDEEQRDARIRVQDVRLKRRERERERPASIVVDDDRDRGEKPQRVELGDERVAAGFLHDPIFPSRHFAMSA